MIGLAIGLGVLGFFIAHRARRHAYAHARGWGWGMHPGGRHHPHGPWGVAHHAGWMHYISRRLDTTPAQERVIQREISGVIETARDARRSALAGRPELARAIGSPVFDADAAAAGFASVTTAVGGLQTRAIEALRNIHEVLDDQQRQELAEIIDSARWRFAGRRGPYR